MQFIATDGNVVSPVSCKSGKVISPAAKEKFVFKELLCPSSNNDSNAFRFTTKRSPFMEVVFHPFEKESSITSIFRLARRVSVAV